MSGNKSSPPKSAAECRRILQMLDRINPIVALMLEFAALSGLRYSDVGMIKKRDVMINGVVRESFDLIQQKPFNKRVTCGMSVADAKNKSRITINLNQQCVDIIDDVHKLEPRGVLLFESSKVEGKPYSIQYINRMLKTVAIKLRLPYALSTHSFRKMFALMLIDNGARIHQVRDALGHGSIATTDHYLSSFSGDAKKLVDKLRF